MEEEGGERDRGREREERRGLDGEEREEMEEEGGEKEGQEMGEERGEKAINLCTIVCVIYLHYYCCGCGLLY